MSSIECQANVKNEKPFSKKIPCFLSDFQIMLQVSHSPSPSLHYFGAEVVGRYSMSGNYQKNARIS